ncbi:hypothetical protein CANMA_003610 [Candida margitis]|uniref:uncharacterized protein n=1 Tax=Candida margitis TaxID=1775924 RepID=UPI002225CBA2|nr:uncharacterized protein CANMA_003610 [Candida margitis]KAI5962835.1 hypothetical protein CANMA_003610 [Candida margitis]
MELLLLAVGATLTMSAYDDRSSRRNTNFDYDYGCDYGSCYSSRRSTGLCQSRCRNYYSCHNSHQCKEGISGAASSVQHSLSRSGSASYSSTPVAGRTTQTVTNKSQTRSKPKGLPRQVAKPAPKAASKPVPELANNLKTRDCPSEASGSTKLNNLKNSPNLSKKSFSFSSFFKRSQKDNIIAQPVKSDQGAASSKTKINKNEAGVAKANNDNVKESALKPPSFEESMGDEVLRVEDEDECVALPGYTFEPPPSYDD